MSSIDTRHPRHPCDPLNGDEIAKAAAIVLREAKLDPSAWFETIAPKEPDKAEVRAFRDGVPFSRKALVCCYEPESNRTLEMIVDLVSGRLENLHSVVGAQARIVADEFDAGGKVAREDPAFIAACARRGITDMS